MAKKQGKYNQKRGREKMKINTITLIGKTARYRMNENTQ